MSDGQLLERFVARREGAALEALVLRHGPMVWGTVRRVLRKATGTEGPKFILHDPSTGLYTLDPDTVDVDLWRMLTAIQSYEQRAVPFSAWLLRITHNMAIDYLRRRMPVCDEPERAAARSGP